MDLDHLVDYQLTAVSDTTQIVTPRWRQLESEVRKQVAQLAKIKAHFGALALEGEMKEGEVEGFLEKKNALKTEIESKQQDLENLKN